MDAVVRPQVKVPLVLVLALAVHGVVLGHLRVFGVAPDLMLAVAVSAGFAGGPADGAVVGFVAGMAVDAIYLETPLGLSALVFCLIGYVVGRARGGLLRTAWWIPIAIAFLASTAGELLFALTGAVVGQGQLVTRRLPVVMVVVGVLNAVLAPLVVRIMRWSLRGGEPARKAYAS